MDKQAVLQTHTLQPIVTMQLDRCHKVGYLNGVNYSYQFDSLNRLIDLQINKLGATPSVRGIYFKAVTSLNWSILIR